MDQVHHLLVIFWILQDCYLLPLEGAEGQSKCGWR